MVPRATGGSPAGGLPRSRFNLNGSLLDNSFHLLLAFFSQLYVFGLLRSQVLPANVGGRNVIRWKGLTSMHVSSYLHILIQSKNKAPPCFQNVFGMTPVNFSTRMYILRHIRCTRTRINVDLTSV